MLLRFRWILGNTSPVTLWVRFTHDLTTLPPYRWYSPKADHDSALCLPLGGIGSNLFAIRPSRRTTVTRRRMVVQIVCLFEFKSNKHTRFPYVLVVGMSLYYVTPYVVVY